jgi:hypothetical protein
MSALAARRGKGHVGTCPGREAAARKTREYAEAVKPVIEAVRDLMVSEGRGTSLRAIAAELNCSGIYTVRGGLGSVSGADRAAGAGSAPG